MDIIEPIWKGFVTGMMFTMTFGTVFFSLIQTSIKRGLRQGLLIAGGVLLSDAFFISMAVFSSTFIADEIKHYDHIIRLTGFIFLIIIGIRSIMKHNKISSVENQPVEKKDILYVMKGVMLNSINPMVALAWIGVAAFVETTNQFVFNQVLLFFAVVLATMFGTMAGICYFARKLRDVLSEKNMHRLNLFSGILFIIFAFVIIWPVIRLIKY
jgi:L-lysine exporter family protein LysE/ArgO